MADLSVKIKDLELKNPVMTASGTFGYGLEFADFVPLEEIGGIIVKGTTLEPREGNDYPRMAETPQGMLNCVGLQNKGVEYFCSHIYPQIKDIDTNMIVNVSGHSPESYAECAARINELDKIPAIELNISCPNVKDGGMAFGVTCDGAASVVKAVRKVYKKTLIVKLSPNVTSIADIARAVEAEGADSVSLINTLMGMAVDIEKRQPLLSIRTGGLSGPCVKPVALRMVWDVVHAVNIPVVGLGGISSAKDAIEFLMCGATAIEIGTANFIDPAVTKKVKDGINECNQVMSVPTPVIGRNLEVLKDELKLSSAELTVMQKGEPLTLIMEDEQVTVGIDLNDKTGIRINQGDSQKWKENTKREWDKYTFGCYGCWVMGDDGNLDYVPEEEYTEELWNEQKKNGERNRASFSMHK